MTRSPPACTHRTRMMPPMKLGMSNLAWENSGAELVLPPSPREGGKRRSAPKLQRRAEQKVPLPPGCTCFAFSSSLSYSLHNFGLKRAVIQTDGNALWSGQPLWPPTCAQFRHPGPAAVPSFVYRVTVTTHTRACVISCDRDNALHLQPACNMCVLSAD